MWTVKACRITDKGKRARVARALFKGGFPLYTAHHVVNGDPVEMYGRQSADALAGALAAFDVETQIEE